MLPPTQPAHDAHRCGCMRQQSGLRQGPATSRRAKAAARQCCRAPRFANCARCDRAAAANSCTVRMGRLGGRSLLRWRAPNMRATSSWERRGNVQLLRLAPSNVRRDSRPALRADARPGGSPRVGGPVCGGARLARVRHAWREAHVVIRCDACAANAAGAVLDRRQRGGGHPGSRVGVDAGPIWRCAGVCGCARAVAVLVHGPTKARAPRLRCGAARRCTAAPIARRRLPHAGGVRRRSSAGTKPIRSRCAALGLSCARAASLTCARIAQAWRHGPAAQLQPAGARRGRRRRRRRQRRRASKGGSRR